jgi:hypothetical protein
MTVKPLEPFSCDAMMKPVLHCQYRKLELLFYEFSILAFANNTSSSNYVITISNGIDSDYVYFSARFSDFFYLSDVFCVVSSLEYILSYSFLCFSLFVILIFFVGCQFFHIFFFRPHFSLCCVFTLFTNQKLKQSKNYNHTISSSCRHTYIHTTYIPFFCDILWVVCCCCGKYEKGKKIKYLFRQR